MADMWWFGVMAAAWTAVATGFLRNATMPPAMPWEVNSRSIPNFPAPSFNPVSALSGMVLWWPGRLLPVALPATAAATAFLCSATAIRGQRSAGRSRSIWKHRAIRPSRGLLNSPAVTLWWSGLLQPVGLPGMVPVTGCSRVYSMPVAHRLVARYRSIPPRAVTSRTPPLPPLQAVVSLLSGPIRVAQTAVAVGFLVRSLTRPAIQ